MTEEKKRRDDGKGQGTVPQALFGKNGDFHFMLENFLNSVLEAKMDDHLAGNRAEGLSGRIISLYARTEHPRHRQVRRGLPPPDSQGDEDQGRVQFESLLKRLLPHIPQHKKKMDHAVGKLVPDCATTVHKVRRQV